MFEMLCPYCKLHIRGDSGIELVYSYFEHRQADHAEVLTPQLDYMEPVSRPGTRSRSRGDGQGAA